MNHFDKEEHRMKTILEGTLDSIRNIGYKWKMLKHMPRLKRYENYIPEDEFHHSLNIDIDAYSDMNPDDRQKYLNNLVRRRELAHQRDLDRRT